MTPVNFNLLVAFSLGASIICYIAETESCSEGNDDDFASDDNYRNVLTEHFKALILLKLGLTAPPNVTKVEIPSFIMEQFTRSAEYVSSHADEQDPSVFADTQEILVFLEITNCTATEEVRYSDLCLTTQFSGQDINGVVNSGDFWVHMVSNCAHTNCSIVIEEVFSDSDQNESVHLAAANIWNSTGWHRIDFLHVLQRWSRQSDPVHKIRITCTHCDSAVQSFLSWEVNEKPTLSVRFTPHQKRPLLRNRRSWACGPGVNICCKQSFIIYFRDIGWDTWIAAPEFYDASFCTGSCTGDPNLIQYGHTMVKRKYIESGGHNCTFLKVCCVATQLKNISIMYLDENLKITLSNLTNMQVESCGCV